MMTAREYPCGCVFTSDISPDRAYSGEGGRLCKRAHEIVDMHSTMSTDVHNSYNIEFARHINIAIERLDEDNAPTDA
jgi:hypothetical protein